MGGSGISESAKKAARKALVTKRKKQEKHDSYLKRTEWIRERNRFLKPFLVYWKKESPDDACCVVCGEAMPNTLHRHHLDGNRRNNRGNNKITLCGSCHIIINKARSDEEALQDFRERHKRVVK
jgi:hypothetical protein